MHAFTVVARHESISRAARELHISQSPLSRQIMALEEALGVQLFARARQRLRLTVEGRAFLVDARNLLAQAESVERRRPMPLNVGYVPAAVHCGALIKDLAQLRRRMPDVPVALHALSSAEQADALVRGEIDLSYAHDPPSERSELVAREEFVLASPTSGRPAHLLERHPLIWLPGATPAHEALLAACRALGVVPHQWIEARDPLVVLALVREGLGVSFVQRSLRTRAKEVRFIALPARFGLEVRVHRTWGVHVAKERSRWLAPSSLR